MQSNKQTVAHHILNLPIAETIEEGSKETLEGCEKGGGKRPKGEVGDVGIIRVEGDLKDVCDAKEGL